MEREIKGFKEGANLKKVEKSEKFPINFSLFQDFFDDNNIDDLIQNYNNSCPNDDLKLKIKSKKRWIVEFPYKIIYKYINEQANLVLKSIQEIIEKKSLINTIIFVGGYCSNDILISLIKKKLGKGINYLQPSNPSLAIMEGAVLFGLNPKIINTRISRYTIGSGTRDVWNNEKHSKFGKKVFDEKLITYIDVKIVLVNLLEWDKN